MRERFLAGLVRNISAGTRLALFLPVRWNHFSATAGQYALLAGFNLLVWGVSNTVQTGGGVFNSTAVGLYLAQIPLLLLACVLIAATRGNTSPGDTGLIVRLAVALSSSDLAFELSAVALLGAAPGAGGEWVFWAFVTWGWMVSVRAVQICAGISWRQSAVPAVIIAVLMAFSLVMLPRAELWLTAPATPQRPALSGEGAFHAQGELIERQLAAIEAGQPGVTELYFAGFAPDGSQDVFLREMRSVKALVERWFDAAGRSITLVSNPATAAEFPIATATNLRRALAQMGKRMNPEDVLLLYVTAHGDRGNALSASAPPLDLAPVNPTVLARALDDAGIKWRVLVISACYSGGFIEPLKNDNTLIITAAAADRQSFGCESGNEWTYFGEAYFRHALEKSKSFIEAFPLAARIVAEREAAEKLTPPSNPQMFAGRAIAARLKELNPIP
jgi:hypothetical protein